MRRTFISVITAGMMLPAVPFTTVAAVPGRMSLLAPYLSLFWLAGVCACHLWQLAGMFSIRRLRRRGVWSAMEQWQRTLGRLGTSLGITKSVTLLESLMVNTPVVTDIFVR